MVKIVITDVDKNTICDECGKPFKNGDEIIINWSYEQILCVRCGDSN